MTAALRRRTAALLLGAVAASAAAQPAPAAGPTLTFNGRMGDRALLVIDGQPRTVAVGAVVQGVRLLAVDDDGARVEVDGRSVLLRQGTPTRLAGGPTAPSGGREVVLSAGPGGHFMTQGSINGRPVQFMVDTGATVVAMGEADASRIGLAWRDAPRALINTANGPSTAHVVELRSLRLGDVEVYGVQAVVMPAAMPYVLLGNSVLSRFRMQREGDVMRLEKR
ncbi:TIGR02281 family clan AA aspartic protease [Aquabacterium sp. J223]|uniref:retropepsin-like aspartic protease family protein n=1 Tax=Aquabacterium sp. J223 TaxID=2898431 RepID=UPI0021ADD2D5|nr:retropepsin-like aspartic protease [Aquabacterium sp. J223]UUX94098.1 retroviral-like aspartic protease family protein [Aquabacterium sp. J223]